MRLLTVFTAVLAASSLAFSRPAWGASSCVALRDEAERALRNLRSSDSAMTKFFETSAAYAVFPGVRQSGAGLGGEPAPGILYEKGKPVGEAALTERRPEPQESATAFHEVIFFETAEALENFKAGTFVVSTEIGAVAAAEGACLTANYRMGVLVVVVPKNGLMAPITLGEQKFSYKPLR